MAAPSQLSFLPDDYLERKQSRRTNAICATLFVIVVGSVFAAWWFTKRSLAGLELQYTAIDGQYTEAAKRIEQVRQMQDKQRTMATQAELTASLLERVPRSHLLAEITNAMPAGLSLLEFDLTSRVRPTAVKLPAANQPNVSAFDAAKAAQEQAKKTPEPRKYDVSMKLTGVAQNDVQVAAFITKLGVSKLFKEVNLAVSEEHEMDNRKVRKFTMDLTLDPEARVLTDGTKSVPMKTSAKGGAQ